jgi:hypothetical protein
MSITYAPQLPPVDLWSDHDGGHWIFVPDLVQVVGRCWHASNGVWVAQTAGQHEYHVREHLADAVAAVVAEWLDTQRIRYAAPDPDAPVQGQRAHTVWVDDLGAS